MTQDSFTATIAAMTIEDAREYLNRLFPGKSDYTYETILRIHGIENDRRG